MRLLNTKSLVLDYFVEPNIPPYVILSHTWGKEEVLFEDIQNRCAEGKRGFAKLHGCCRKALEDGFEWVWIDTCAIDKSSSAELSEAINSMYRWYQGSVICYSYLEDVASDPRNLEGQSLGIDRFTESRWFSRGWTLQELIAPRCVEFYTADWTEIGTKRSLCNDISMATGIPVRILRGADLSTCCIAQRMSWASKRQTTREEDIAYCLLGLFDVNMPMVYGEGRKAFTRLQEEIMKKDEDYSIFAWSLRLGYFGQSSGALASSPADFSDSVPIYLGDSDRQNKQKFLAEVDELRTRYSEEQGKIDERSRRRLKRIEAELDVKRKQLLYMVEKYQIDSVKLRERLEKEYQRPEKEDHDRSRELHEVNLDPPERRQGHERLIKEWEDARDKVIDRLKRRPRQISFEDCMKILEMDREIFEEKKTWILFEADAAALQLRHEQENCFNEIQQRIATNDHSPLDAKSSYQPIYERDYEKLASVNTLNAEERMPFKKLLDTLDTQEPPQLTSRGLRIRLPLEVLPEPDRPLMAWIYCFMNKQPVGIYVQRRDESSNIFVRQEAHALFTFAPEKLESFRITELHMVSAGVIGPTVVEPPNPWGRVKMNIVNTPGLEQGHVELVSVHPQDIWMLDELIYKGRPKIIGIALFEHTWEENSEYFTVLLGEHNNMYWCDTHMEPGFSQISNAATNARLETLYSAASKLSADIYSNLSDRSVAFAGDGLVFLAAVRNCSRIVESVPAHTLQVSIRRQASIWP